MIFSRNAQKSDVVIPRDINKVIKRQLSSLNGMTPQEITTNEFHVIPLEPLHLLHVTV